MALTPEDVSNKRFTTVRLREGYDMTEVDQFLDEVEAELTRASGENAELRAQLQAALGGEPVSSVTASPDSPAQDAAAPAAEETVALEPDAGADAGPGAGPAAAVASAPAAAASLETLQVTTTAEASAAATRLLELAGSNADQLVAEARAQAEQIVGESQGRAEALEAEARSRADALESETEQRRT